MIQPNITTTKLLCACLLLLVLYFDTAHSAEAQFWQNINFSNPVERLQIPLISSGHELGEISVLMNSLAVQEVHLLNLSSLLNLNESLVHKLHNHTNEKGFLSVETLQNMGFQLELDQENLSLLAQAPLSHMQRQTIGRSTHRSSRQDTSITPADISFYINAKAGMEYESTSTQKKSKSQQLNLDSALQFYEWVLESQVQYNSQSQIPWRRADTHFTRFLNDQDSKLKIGDISPAVTGFQRSYPALGVSFSNNLNKIRSSSAITVGDSEFELENSSKVEIWVNQQLRQTLFLQRGRYQLKELVGLTGLSDVTLKILDGVGNSRIKNFKALGMQQLIPKGEHDYAITLGRLENLDSLDKSYSDSRLLSTYYRYGLNHLNTLGFNVQLLDNVQLIGAELRNLSRLGSIAIHHAVSYNLENSSGTSTQLQYNFNSSSLGAFALLTKKQSVDYGVSTNNTSPHKLSKEFSARYSKRFNNRFNISVGNRWSHYYNDSHVYQSTHFSINMHWNSEWLIKLETARTDQFDFPAEDRFVLSISWRGLGSPHIFESREDYKTETSNVNYYYRPDDNPWLTNASLNWSENRLINSQTTDSQLFYQGQRIESSYDMTYTTQANKFVRRRQQINLGSSLVMAGNHFSWSRPISNSFAIVDSKVPLKDSTLGLNPDSYGRYHTQIDKWNSGVVSFPAYSISTISAEADNPDQLYLLETDSLKVRSGYKTGTYLEIGSKNKVYLTGKLFNSSGEIISLQAGEVISDNQESSVFFTDETGYFEADNLTQGKYKLRIFSLLDEEAKFEIEAREKGFVQKGDIHLRLPL